MIHNEENTNIAVLRNLARKPRIHWTDADKKEFAARAEQENNNDIIIESPTERKNTAAARNENHGETVIEPQDGRRAVRGEIALWRAVITQALTDAFSQSSKVEMQYESRKARVWLEGRSDDFHTVCSLAQMPFDYVRERSMRALADRASNNLRIAADNKKMESVVEETCL